jgi:hypothetical protein
MGIARALPDAWFLSGFAERGAMALWPAASTDPPQLIALAAPQAVADLICSAQLAERARTWRQTNTRI